MTDPSRYPNADAEPDHESPPRMPRWVKVSGIVVIVVIVLLIGLMSITGHRGGPGAGGHGAGPHGTGSQSAEQIELRAPEGDT